MITRNTRRLVLPAIIADSRLGAKGVRWQIIGAMASSLFEEMAAVLVGVAEEINAVSASNSNIMEDGRQTTKTAATETKDRDQQTSLLTADPNAFYANSAFFDRLPARPSRPSCSLGERCGSSPAIIICHSCARFNDGHCHFCRGCFEVSHPWYRVAHKWSWLEGAESTKVELDRQVYRASLERNIADVRGLLQFTSSRRSVLHIQNEDTKGDDLIKEAARDTSCMGIKIRDLADLVCEDRTKVSKIALNGMVREAVRSQKNYEAKEIADGEAGSLVWRAGG